ncbi:hypothetical protein E2C01_003977 [Portunus trituberculatus]|uniref:Uncharacterized protein n=1 Tax=Portunus trituberculatus TaxID=210409 RepID=A0A5B7CRM4_PORTR|nr:hypothetical protein [Portunus trituberculatus]
MPITYQLLKVAEDGHTSLIGERKWVLGVIPELGIRPTVSDALKEEVYVAVGVNKAWGKGLHYQLFVIKICLKNVCTWNLLNDPLDDFLGAVLQLRVVTSKYLEGSLEASQEVSLTGGQSSDLLGPFLQLLASAGFPSVPKHLCPPHLHLLLMRKDTMWQTDCTSQNPRMMGQTFAVSAHNSETKCPLYFGDE